MKLASYEMVIFIVSS